MTKRWLVAVLAALAAVLGLAGVTAATTSASAAPVVPSTWKTVNTAGYTSCGIAANSKLYCWGYNGYGQLGQGGETDSGSHPTPTQVGTSNWLSVRVSYTNVCGVKTDHTAWCWGYTGYNSLGSGTESDDSYVTTPTKVAGNIAWSSVVSGYYNSCGISTTHKLYCWGTDSDGGVGDGPGNTSTNSPRRVGTAANWSTVTLGYYSTCAVKATKEGYCWGDGTYGMVGNGSTDDAFSPVKLPNTWSSLTATAQTVCGVTGGGTARCWGYNGYGQVGDGTTEQRNTPTTLSEQYDTFSKMYVGYYSTCGLRKADNAVRCFGYNEDGEFGDGGTTSSATPVPALGGAGGWSPIWVGDYTGCGIRPTGALYCWGYNGYGETGVDNGGNDVYSPTKVGSTVIVVNKHRGAAPKPPTGGPKRP